MQPATRRTRRHAVALIAITLTLAACGDDDDAGSSTTAPTTADETTVPDTSSPDTTTPETTTPDTTTAPTASAAPDTTGPASSGPEATTEPDGTTEPSAGPETTSSSSAPPATYVVEDGDTLFAIAEDNDITVDELVAANGWSDGEEHPIFPGDVITLPSGGATATATTVEAGGVPEEAVSAREVLELELTDGSSTPIADPLDDGVYFARQAEPAVDGAIALTLAQFETTEACEARLAESTVPDDTTADTTCEGYHVIETPAATIELPADSDAPVVVLLAAPPDVVDLLAYETTADVWRQLLDGDAPAWSSEWLPGNAFVQITDGEITRVEVSVIGS